MVMDNISTILPNISLSDFQKIINSLDIKQYKCPTKSTMVLYYPSSDRNLRKAILLDLTKLIPNSEYKDDGRSGHLILPNKAKIFLKPLKTSGGIILKPALFGSSMNKLVDKDIPYRDYYDLVNKAIQTTKELTVEQQEVLLTIVKYARKEVSQREVATLLETLGESISINTISNDFGEVLGALGINSHNLLPMIDWRTASIFIPKAGNYPLLDYIIKDANREYKISAKSGNTTNTLKPGDVKAIIDQDDNLLKRWVNTDQYGVIDQLTNNTWKQGPISAAQYLNATKRYKTVEWAVGSISYSEPFRQQAENDLVKISKEDLDFTDIFMDAVLSSEVYYVKYALNKAGVQSWHLVRTEKVPTTNAFRKRVVLRSKNFIGRPNGDKLGFQP